MSFKPKTSRRPPLSPKRAQLAATFRLAAEVMDEVPLSSSRGCCHALTVAERMITGAEPPYPPLDYRDEPIVGTLITLLAPNARRSWWYADEEPILNEVGTRNARIIGLLLCAHLIEDNAVPLAGL